MYPGFKGSASVHGICALWRRLSYTHALWYKIDRPLRSGAYDPLSTLGKIISLGSLGITSGFTLGTSLVSAGDNFSRGR